MSFRAVYCQSVFRCTQSSLIDLLHKQPVESVINKANNKIYEVPTSLGGKAVPLLTGKDK